MSDLLVQFMFEAFGLLLVYEYQAADPAIRVQTCRLYSAGVHTFPVDEGECGFALSRRIRFAWEDIYMHIGHSLFRQFIDRNPEWFAHYEARRRAKEWAGKLVSEWWRRSPNGHILDQVIGAYEWGDVTQALYLLDKFSAREHLNNLDFWEDPLFQSYLLAEIVRIEEVSRQDKPVV